MLETELYHFIQTDRKHYDFIQNYALDGMFFWDLKDQENLWVNPKLRSLLGYSQEGKSSEAFIWKDVFDQKDLNFAIEFGIKNQENVEPYCQVLSLTHRNGSTISFDGYFLIIQDGNKNPFRMLGALQDVSGVKKWDQELLVAREKIEKSESRYRKLFENMNTGFVLFEVIQDPQGKPLDLLILAANEMFRKTTGLNLRDAIGRKLTSVLPGIEKDEADWIGTYSRVALSGESISYDQGSELLGYFYSISAFQAAPNQCAVTFLDITERKQAENLLADSEERLRLTTEQAEIAVWEYDFDSNSMSRSGNHDKLYGLEWQTKWDINTFLEATHPEDREFSNKTIKRSVVPGGPDNYNFDFRVVFPDKSIRWLSVNGKVIQRDQKGVGVRVRGTLADITEVKENELALRESELRFRMAINYAPFPILIHAEDGQVIEVNASWTRLTGYKQSDIPTIADWTEKAYGTHKASIKEYIDSLYCLNSPKTEGEFKIRTSSGEFRFWEFSSGPIGKLSDERRLVITMAMDITERKKFEIDLINTSRLLKNSQELAHLGSFEFIVADESIVWSEEEYKIYGLDPTCPSPGYNEMLEKYILPEDVNRLHSTLTTAMERKEGFELEHRVIRPNGSIRWVYNKAHPILDEQGNLLRYVGATLDITERKQLQEELEKLNAELEVKVKQRTLLLEASNQELEAFSYSVSHDLRAPLRHINGYVDLLYQRYNNDLPEKAQHYLKVISRASSQMGILIDELLHYSKTGRTEVRKTEINFNLLVQEVKEELKIAKENRKIEWEIQHLPRVYGDPSLLKLVWRNLLENALKYSSKKPISKISVSYVEKEVYFVFSVEDNGVGFEMKYAQKLFGVFQRLHSQTEFEGTGIGLANVQRIIHKHSGKVWAEAEPGKRAIFYFSLPKKLEEVS